MTKEKLMKNWQAQTSSSSSAGKNFNFITKTFFAAAGKKTTNSLSLNRLNKNTWQLCVRDAPMPLSWSEFSVGWVSALSIKTKAARVFLNIGVHFLPSGPFFFSVPILLLPHSHMPHDKYFIIIYYFQKFHMEQTLFKVGGPDGKEGTRWQKLLFTSTEFRTHTECGQWHRHLFHTLCPVLLHRQLGVQK